MCTNPGLKPSDYNVAKQSLLEKRVTSQGVWQPGIMAHVYNPNADGKQEDHHEPKGGRKEDRKTYRRQRESDWFHQALWHNIRGLINLIYSSELIQLPPSQNPQNTCILVLTWHSGLQVFSHGVSNAPPPSLFLSTHPLAGILNPFCPTLASK